jgi:hypothetical protein
MSSTANIESYAVGIRNSEPRSIGLDSALSITVVFTSLNWTLKALKKARDLAEQLGSHIEVVAVQVVPFPLPLDEPPVQMEFLLRRFEEMAGELPEKTKVSAFLCRSRMSAFKRILKPDSLVVMGAREHWFPSSYERLARKLVHIGYNVLLVETE